MNKKREKLVRKLKNKEYRDAWVEESVKTVVPFQIQAIRTQREWTQGKLGEQAGMLPHAVTRVESINYGNLSINTLLRIAHGFDCGLLVKLVPFRRMVQEFEDVSSAALDASEFAQDMDALESWATAENALDVTSASKQYATSTGNALSVVSPTKGEHQLVLPFDQPELKIVGGTPTQNIHKRSTRERTHIKKETLWQKKRRIHLNQKLTSGSAKTFKTFTATRYSSM